jgi:hypothetical protein
MNCILSTVLPIFLLSACSFSTQANDAPTITPTPKIPATGTPPAATTILPNALVHTEAHFQVFILSPLTACLVGNEFVSGDVCAGTKCGDCSCSPEDFDPPAPLTGVPPERTTDPQYAAYQHKICLDITLTDEEIAAIESNMDLMREQVYEWSGGSLDLQMEYTVLPDIFTGFVAPELVIGPFEIDDELLNDYVKPGTDFVYAVSGAYDRAQDLRLGYWCGSSYGELNIRGANYAYIQYNHEACNSVTIDGQTVYEPLIHEWMHGLDWALYNIDSVSDRYQWNNPDWVNWKHGFWPACGSGAPDPLDWFPSVDLCEWDPDWMDCNNVASAGICLNAGEVDGSISWYEHVISAHYPRDLQFVGNTCQDGKQDFSETGVDSGGPCP